MGQLFHQLEDLADRLPDLEAAAKLIMDGKLGLAQSKYNG